MAFQPQRLVLALSHAYGSCIPSPITSIRIVPCPACARANGAPRITRCWLCRGRNFLEALT